MGRDAEKAMVLMEMHRHADAIHAWHRIIAEEPQNAEAFQFLAECHWHEGHNEAALREIETAIGLAPELKGSFRIRALVLARLGQISDARAAIMQELALGHTANDLAIYAAHCLDSFDWDDARDAIDSGLQIDPQNDVCLAMKAALASRMGEHAEAEQIAKGILAKTPNSSAAHDSLGSVHIKASNFSDASSSFQEALRLDPTGSRGVENLFHAKVKSHWIVKLIILGSLWWTSCRYVIRWGIFAGASTLYGVTQFYKWPSLHFVGQAVIFASTLVMWNFLLFDFFSQRARRVFIKLSPIRFPNRLAVALHVTIVMMAGLSIAWLAILWPTAGFLVVGIGCMIDSVQEISIKAGEHDTAIVCSLIAMLIVIVTIPFLANRGIYSVIVAAIFFGAALIGPLLSKGDANVRNSC